MAAGANEIAAPFYCQAVTSGFAVSNGLVDLKRAAAFYDRILIVDADIFERKLADALGPDLDYLQENGLIEIFDVAEYPHIPEGQPGHAYAEKIRGGLAAALFSASENRAKTHEVCGNGLARLQAAALQSASADDHFSPLVTGRKVMPALKRSARYQIANDEPLPSDSLLEALLPVRATATRMVFEQLPVPSHETPWEDILHFRADNDTGLYAAQLRLFLHDLAKESDRRHVEDLVRTQFSAFDKKISAFKGKQRRAVVRWVLPWADKLHDLAKAIALLKFSEVINSHVKVSEEVATLNEAENNLQRDPYYLIEHIRRTLA